jgi:hypothetical protein
MNAMAEGPRLRDGCRLRLVRPMPHPESREPLVFFVTPILPHFCEGKKISRND